MDGQIRPLPVFDMLDAGFRVLRERFLLLTGLGAVLYVPLALGLVAAVRPFLQPGAYAPDPDRLAVVAAALGAWGLVAGALVHIALVHAAGQLYARQAVTAGGALRAAVRLFVPCVGTVALVAAAFHAGFLALVSMPRRLPGAGTVPAAGVALFVIAAVYAFGSLLLLGPVLVLERHFWLAAIRRSHALMAGRRIRGLLVTVLALGLVALLGVAALAVGFVSLWAGALAWGIVHAAGAAWTCAVWVALYADARCRTEALDSGGAGGPGPCAGART